MEKEKEISNVPKTLLKRVVEGFLVILGVDEWVTYQKVINNALFFLFIVAIGVFHVSHNLSAEGMNRNISRKQQQVKELRWEYMTIKSDLMFRSKQSELTKLLEPHGIKELTVPPQTIIVEKGEY